MSAEQTKKPRPYWHVDAKWISGLILAFLLSATLLVYGLVQVTAEQPAVEALTLATALMFSPNGLDDATEIDIMRLALLASPDGTIQPIPGLRISVSEQEIEGLTSREIRLFYFQKWAEPIYQEGIQGLADLADDPELKAQILEGGSMFNALTLQTHHSLQRVFRYFVVACLVMLIPLVLFSFRFGRIGNPGCVFFFASLPGAVIFTLIGMAVKPVITPAEGEQAITGMLTTLASNVLPAIARELGRIHLMVLGLGVGLVLLAAISSIVWNLMRGDK
mgnify:CR=1 FL=1